MQSPSDNVNISALPSSLPPGLPVSLCVTYQFPACCFFKKLVFIEISVAMAWSTPNRPMFWMFGLQLVVPVYGEWWFGGFGRWGLAGGGRLLGPGPWGCIVYFLSYFSPPQRVTDNCCYAPPLPWCMSAFATNGRRSCLPPLSGFCLAFCQSRVRVINTLVIDSVNEQLFTNVEVSSIDIRGKPLQVFCLYSQSKRFPIM